MSAVVSFGVRSSARALGRDSAARLVTFSRVGKTFDRGVVALKDVDLTVYEGEFLSLLGPSGCGKSTMLRIVAGLAGVTRGSLAWNDEQSPSARREIGFVFQEPTLMPWATVVGNIMVPLKLRGTAKAEARPRVQQAIAQVGLSGFERAYPRQLSGGMRMRVSIARALVAEPRILLMDEPFAALDEITRSKLNDDLLRLWADQRWTIVFVTHSVYESVYLSSRIAVMTARPGMITAEVAVEQPYPRSQEFRTTPTYGEYCRKVSALLAETLNDDTRR